MLKILSIRRIRIIALTLFVFCIVIFFSITLINTANINNNEKIVKTTDGKNDENTLPKNINNEINDNKNLDNEITNEIINNDNEYLNNSLNDSKDNEKTNLNNENIQNEDNDMISENMDNDNLNEDITNNDNLSEDITNNDNLNEDMDDYINDNENPETNIQVEINEDKELEKTVIDVVENENIPSEQQSIDNLITKEAKKKPEFKLYHSGSNYRDGDDPTGSDCPIAWQWTYNKEESDIIMLNTLDNYGSIISIENFKYNKKKQKLLLMSMESTSNYPFMIKNKKYFDYMIDYRLDSDVPIPYTYTFFDFSKMPLPTKEKGKDGRGLAAVFISNCLAKNDRLEYLKELIKYSKIDSYGMCENNKEPYDEDYDKSSWNLKMNTIKKYKFTLAFENSNDRDYVTEKFFQPLEVGSVPVFYGTTNIYDFAPPNSYIAASDFESAKELAEYLDYLDKNDDEYEKYLEWKYTGEWGDNFKRVIEIRKMNSICQLLQRIKNMWINPYLTKWKRPEIPDSERACRLC